ncbi:hypothetical protein DXG01_004749 [Tephrocybe rancida]|nr:hypothetical protein DXG01_004749 [Tephrocybe rancida]
MTTIGRSSSPTSIQADFIISRNVIGQYIATAPTGPTAPQTSRSTMPANTSIFHGRHPIVAELASIITRPSPQHICLLGPGGMGKTSTALAVMEHADVHAYFTDQLVWVPCVKATSLSIFLDTLHTSLGIATKSLNPLNDILSYLKGLSVPIVLLLDNFETPWNTNDIESLSSEGNNLEAVLLTATADPRIIRYGLLELVEYQCHRRPRLDVIEHSLKLANDPDIDDKSLQADIYFCYGNILITLCYNGNALRAFTQALTLYQSVSDQWNSAHCRLALAVVMRQTKTFAVQEENIVAAQADCEWLGDDVLSASCLLERGVLYHPYGQLVLTLQFLMQAEPILAHEFYCSLEISHAYMSLEDYDSAHQWATSTFEKVAKHGATVDHATAVCNLAVLYHRFGKYEQSIRSMHRCQEIYASLGQPLSGYKLLVMGLALVGAERTADGRQVLDEALRMLSFEGSLSDRTVSWQFILHCTDNQMIEPTPDEMAALRG